MDKKQRKKWHAQLMERLGAKAEKAPRCSANIGQGMAKKQAQRAARALQAAVADGTVRVKGMGKKRQAEKGSRHSLGLVCSSLPLPSFPCSCLMLMALIRYLSLVLMPCRQAARLGPSGGRGHGLLLQGRSAQGQEADRQGAACWKGVQAVAMRDRSHSMATLKQHSL